MSLPRTVTGESCCFLDGMNMTGSFVLPGFSMRELSSHFSKKGCKLQIYMWLSVILCGVCVCVCVCGCVCNSRS